MSDDLVLLLFYSPLLLIIAAWVIGTVFGLTFTLGPIIIRGIFFSLSAIVLFLINTPLQLCGMPKVKYRPRWNRNKKEPMGFHPNR